MGREDDRLEALAGQLLDEVLPDSFEWERIVRTYPVAAVLTAALGGYLLGRSRGPAIVSAVSALVTDRVSERFSSLVDPDGAGRDFAPEPFDGDEFDDLEPLSELDEL